MKRLFQALTAMAFTMSVTAAENADTVYVDFGELNQSPPVCFNPQPIEPQVLSNPVNTSLAVGEIPFSEGMSPTGAKIYAIPITISEESRFRPEISLFYNSQGAKGTAGYGWGVSGIPAIAATNKTLHYDGEASSPDLSNPDGCAFALDGVRLLEREDAADGYTLETAEGFIRVQKVKIGTALCRFNVCYPDGRTAVFGFTDNNVTRHIYPVTEMADPDGHRIFYEYSESGNTFYVTDIYYGGSKESECYGHVSFEYSETDDFPLSYRAGVEIHPDKVLKKIVSSVKVNGTETELMHYDLTHSNDGWLLLTKISGGSGTETLNPLVFDYGYSGIAEGVLQKAYDKTICDEDAFASGREMVYVRGKFLQGKYNDGMLMYPEFDPYMTDNDGNIYSSMSADQDIIISTGLSVNGNSFKIKAGEGLRMLTVMDIDADGVDEIIKLNTTFGNSDDDTRIHTSIYKISDGRLTTRQSNHDIASVVTKTENVFGFKKTVKLCPIPLTFLFGNFSGEAKTDMLVIPYRYNDDAIAFLHYLNLNILSDTYSLPVEKQASYNTTFTTGDFNGDGRDELCEIGSGSTTVYSVSKNDGLQELFRDYTIKYDNLGKDLNALAGLYAVDVNCDGLTDLLYPPDRSRIDEQEQVTVQRWVPEECPVCGKQNPILNDYTKTCRQCGEDIYQYYYKNGGAICPDCGQEMQGDYFPDIDGFVCPTHGRGKITKWIDLDDIINGTEWTALLSTGNGFSTVRHDLGAWNKEKFSLLDIDNDGYVDIVASLDGDISVMLNHEGSFSGSSITLDAKGDVMPFNIHGTGSSHFIAIDDGVAHCYEYTADKSRYGLVTSMASSFGVVSANDYGKMTGEGCHEYAETGSGEMALLAPVNLLARSSKLADGEKVADVSYKYTGSKFNLRGLGFRGFQKITETDSISGLTTVTEYADIDEPIETENDKSRAVYSYANIGSGKFENKRVGSMAVTDKLTTAVTSKSYSYDNYGNMLAEKAYYGSDLYAETTCTYQNNASASRYHVGLPLTKTVRRTRDGEQWTDKETCTYDNCGRPLTRTVHTGTSGAVKKEETRWTYDAYGNVLSEMSSPYDSGTFTGTTYAYDSSGRYLTEETDAMGFTTTYSGFDKYGNPLSEEDSRGNVTEYSYDVFGRLTGKSLPTGASQTAAFAWGGTGLYKVTATESGKPDKVTDYDALGREVRTASLRFDGEWQSVSRRYNAKGQLEAVSMPYAGVSPGLWQEYEYDRFGRQTKLVEPSGSVSEWSYSGLTTTETSRGITRTTRKDATGAVVEVTDPGGSILYSYRPDGQVWLMTAPSEIYTEIFYDGAGRRSSIVDPSAGNRSTAYAYSGGQLTVTETDADGRAVATTYDKYGRIVKETRPEFSTTYGYDGYGQLAMVVSTNGTSRNYIHDSFGRVLTETETVPDGKSLTKAYYYGDDGVTTGMLYSGGQVYHELLYTRTNGTLTAVSLSGGGTVWQLLETDDMGMPVKVKTGDIVREYGYDSYGMPAFRKFGTHQHFTYSFDPYTGNLLSRTDALRGITEEYGYDNLNRLTDENGRQTEYAANGNILSRDGVGTASYNLAPNIYRLNKLTAAADKDFSYSPLSIDYTSFSRPSEITKDKYYAISIPDRLNRASLPGGIGVIDSLISGGGAVPIDTALIDIPINMLPIVATFTYNERGERVKMEVKEGNDVLARRYYIGGVYEVDGLTGEERLYIGGDAYSAPAVDVCDADGQWELHYIGRDYLGSITHIADSEGNLVAEYSYDAWGRLRDPATQELYGNSGVSDLLLWRGFTGHEWLPWFGLYNMNARLYDPVLGRFLSPDPYVQMPDNTQNLNRYIYALNNPFQYKDDSGEFILSMIVGALIGAGVSALTYSVGTLVSGADWDWKNFGKTIGIGAFSGALGGALSFFKETFSNMYIYNMTSKIATKTITDAIFSDFDLKSLHGTITSTLVSAVISTSNESALIQSLNNISEEGYHLLTGTVSSFASGMANSYAYGNTDLIWQSIANGAISSVSNSIVNGLLSSTNQKAEKIELTKLGALSKKKQEWIKRRQDEANNEENTDLGYSANKQNLFSKNIHLPQLPFEYSSSFQMGEASYYNHNLYPIFIY